MVFSKNCKHYRQCISLTRNFSEGGGTSTKLPPQDLSAAQWRTLGQLRELASKGQDVVVREWRSLMIRIQPTLQGQDEWKTVFRNFESALKTQNNRVQSTVASAGQTPPVKTVNTNTTATTATKQIMRNSEEMSQTPAVAEIILPQVKAQEWDSRILEGLGFGKSAIKETETRTWKTYTHALTKTSIYSSTSHIITSIANCETDDERCKRIEDLCNHIHQHPTERSHAVKIGATRILLRVRHESTDATTHEWVNEALARIGYSNPLPGHGLRILAIDGGGTRGVLVIELLKKLEQLTGKRVYEMFDYITGVSTGAILACTLGTKFNLSLEELSQLYKTLSEKMFMTSSPLSVLSSTSRLVWSHAYYDTALWESMLKEYVGETPMIKTSRLSGPKISAVSCVLNASQISAFVFRNYSLPWRIRSVYPGSHDARLWEVVRASSAAPTYFEEFHLAGKLHQDGGIMVNNPTAVAIHEARLLWPGAPIQCVVSFGTGRTHPQILPGGQAPKELSKESPSSSSWKTMFFKILDSATDTEGVHTMLSDLLPAGTYFRFNPYLTEMLTMDEIRPEKITQLKNDASMYLRRNEEKFEQAAYALTEEKPLTAKITDWVRLQADMLGLK